MIQSHEDNTDNIADDDEKISEGIKHEERKCLSSFNPQQAAVEHTEISTTFRKTSQEFVFQCWTFILLHLCINISRVIIVRNKPYHDHTPLAIIV